MFIAKIYFINEREGINYFSLLFSIFQFIFCSIFFYGFGVKVPESFLFLRLICYNSVIKVKKNLVLKWVKFKKITDSGISLIFLARNPFF
ncbi:hypothetical protein D1164_08855 [Mariniphaga sediminis]|uniref:Uncharacterized protein n=1 Tax=Mariniphaga sediminis TaxID=1628158 RepID=A0A399D2Q5_9BACT|nr:hypothetical protein D1164_08855 [Mariniphaga sediminis]